MVVPDDAPVDDLAWSLVAGAGYAPTSARSWVVAVAGGRRLQPDTTLARAGVVDGDDIYVAPAVPATDPAPDRDVQRPPAALDDALPLARRLAATAGALIGATTTREARGGTPLERAASMWRWTDRRRRLRWLIGHPRLRRTIIIGVASVGGVGGSARLAIDLAGVLGGCRNDRLVLVDGEPERALLTRLVGRGHPTVSALATDQATLGDARFGRDGVVGCDLEHPGREEAATYRAALARIRPHAGLIVVDCGPLATSPLIGTCDQVVVGSDRPLAPERLDLARCHIVVGDPREGGLELAADLAVEWGGIADAPLLAPARGGMAADA
jgi:hypothetical protein